MNYMKQIELLNKTYEDVKEAFSKYKMRVLSYYVSSGYLGETQDGKILFPTEEEYEEYLEGE